MIAGLVIFSLCERLGKWQLNNLLLVLLVNMHMIILILAGYITGWNYWFLWVVTCMAEITGWHLHAVLVP